MRTTTHPHDYQRTAGAVGQYLELINRLRTQRMTLERELATLDPKRFFQVCAANWNTDTADYIKILQDEINKISGP